MSMVNLKFLIALRTEVEATATSLISMVSSPVAVFGKVKISILVVYQLFQLIRLREFPHLEQRLKFITRLSRISRQQLNKE